MAVLDPWILHGGLKADYVNDKMLTSYLEGSKENIREYFNENYAGCDTQALELQSSAEAEATLAALQSPTANWLLVLQTPGILHD